MTDDLSASDRARIVANDAGFSVSSLERDERGRAHRVFRVQTHSGTVYVKLSGSPRPRFATEVSALRGLSDFELDAPVLIASSDSFVMTRSLGDDLRPIEPGDADAWSEFGGWLSALHSIDPTGMGLRYDTDPMPLGKRLAHSLERALGDMPEHAVLSAERLRNRLETADLPSRFTHRDLRADNVLVRSDGRFAGVVDFEHAAGAPPAWDLVKALDWNEPTSAAAEAFVDGYGPLPDRCDFRVFEALMILSRPRQRSLYGGWAEQVLAAEA